MDFKNLMIKYPPALEGGKSKRKIKNELPHGFSLWEAIQRQLKNELPHGFSLWEANQRQLKNELPHGFSLWTKRSIIVFT